LVTQSIVLCAVAAIATYFLFVNYADEHSAQVYFFCAAAGLYAAFGGIVASAYSNVVDVKNTVVEHVAQTAASTAASTGVVADPAQVATQVTSALQAQQIVLPYEWLIWGTVGVGVGIAYVVINFGARPAFARSGIQMLCLILMFGTIGVLLYIGRINGSYRGIEVDYVAVACIGGLVGIGELVSRYRDEPSKALLTIPAVIYVAVNAAAAVIALSVAGPAATGAASGASSSDAASSTQAAVILGVHWTPVLTAGLGAMAILRSALFVVRTDGKDLQVGPGSLVQTLLDAADQALDRLRAQERAWTVARVMERLALRTLAPTPGASWMQLRRPPQRRVLKVEELRLLVSDAIATLPPYCIALTQNFPDTKRDEFLQAVAKVSAMTGVSDRIKLFTVGLLAMQSVGPQVLNAAVESLADDLQDRAIRQAEVAERTRVTEQHADDSEQQARATADIARRAVDAHQSNPTGASLKDLLTQAATLAEQSAQAAELVKEDAEDLGKRVMEELAASPVLVVPAAPGPSADGQAPALPAPASPSGGPAPAGPADSPAAPVAVAPTTNGQAETKADPPG
jgi:hypothetical protein